MEVSVAEAADLLGVSARRVRALAQAGRIPARRVGGAWLVTPAGLHGVQRSRRPLSPMMAEGLAAAISAVAAAASGGALTASRHETHDGGERDTQAVQQAVVAAAQYAASKATSEASTRTAQRLAWNRLRERMVDLAGAVGGDAGGDPAELVRSWMAGRMPPVHTYAINSEDLADLAADPRVVPTGSSDPRSGLAVVAQVEARVTRTDLDDLVREFWLREQPEGAVRLLVTETPTPNPVPLGVLVEDLAAHPGPRESAAVTRLLAEQVPWLRAVAAVPARAALYRADWDKWTVQPEHA